MAERHRHLVFAREEPQNPRRRGSQGRSPAPPANLPEHARRLRDELDDVIEHGQPVESGFDPRRVLKITAKGVAADSFEKIEGLSVIAEEEDQLLVVFATDDGLREFKSRLALLETGGSPTRKELLYAIQALSALTRDDRIGPAYRARGLPDGDTAVVDVELWPVLKFEEMVGAFVVWCKSASLTVLDRVVQPSLILLRIRGTKANIERMLDHRDVRVVDFPPSFHLERSELEVTASNVGKVVGPEENAPVVAILDSGIASNHPLLQHAVADAQCYIDGRVAHDEVGHGTAVAGLALYGDVHDCCQRQEFVGRFWLCSGRVLDDANRYDGKLIHNQIANAVADFVKQYSCRVFNVSIGDENRPFTGGHVRGLAIELDRLARLHGVLFVVSAGNYRGVAPFDEPAPNWFKDYPNYLLKNKGARVCDPAPAMNVLTVGALARFEKPHQAQRYPDDPAYQCVARRAEPAPFSRTGPGANGCIKPELSDFGGNWAVDVRGDGQTHLPRLLGEPSAELKFVGSGRWLSDFVGTSFAAPKVAHAAGSILVEYPDATANLLRALLVAHASAPATDSSSQRADLADDKQNLRFWGYGQIHVEPLVHSTEQCVTLLAESKIAKDAHHFYEIPLPDDFLQPGRFRRTISIGLSHMPAVRTTRLEYRASKMSFRLVRAVSVAAVSQVFVHSKKAEREDMTKEYRPGHPTMDARGRGSVQAARYEITQLREDGHALRLFVVVTHSVSPWGVALVSDDEPYALAVVVEDQGRNDVRFFSQMQAKLRQRERARGRAKH